MGDEAKRGDRVDPLAAPAPRVTPGGSRALGQSGVRDLRAQLADAHRVLDALQRKNTELGDELDAMTIRAVRTDVELASSKEREAESARQWLSMSAELGSVRARATRYERLLKRLTERMTMLRAEASGTPLEGEIDDVLGILELHGPPANDD